MILQGQAGAIPSSKQESGNPNVAQGLLTEMLVSELNPAFYTLLKNGLVYFSALSAANPTAFTGGAAGTPLVGLYNPASSGKDIVVLQARIGIRTTGTAAGTLAFNWYLGNSVLPTGTVTPPRNSYSGAQSGSVALPFLNTAMTASTAISPVGPIASVGANPATTPIATVLYTYENTAGTIVCAPGNLIAIGASSSLTAASIDCSVIWAELPA